MPELIDRKYLLAYLSEIKPDEYVSAFGEAAVQVIGMIEEFVKEMPTIEAENMQKQEMSEADRKRCEEWCKDCEHIEMCKWYPFGGCDFRLLPKPEQPTIEPEVRQPTVSTDPERKHGHWIMMDADRAKCSLCGWWQKSNGKDKTGKGLIFSACYHYCTACGARMDGGAENG